MEDKLKSVFSSVFGIPETDVTEDSSPETIDSWDSLKHMNLIVALEEEFEIEFDEDEITELLSFSSIIEILAQKMRSS